MPLGNQWLKLPLASMVTLAAKGAAADMATELLLVRLVTPALSVTVLLFMVSSAVPGITVNGTVLGVKLVVYTAVPMTILKLLICPWK